MYSKTIRESLKDYKCNHLKVADCGEWRTNKYGHILPSSDYKLNILDSIRVDFWVYFNKLKNKIKLHPGFHHLNSSQAMCFNLFYPLFKNDYTLLSKMIEIIINDSTPQSQILNYNVKNCDFEKILDAKEKTNFDFYVELEDGFRVVFEIKYSENGFGSAKKDQTHKDKFCNTYESNLKNILLPNNNKENYVLSNYQLVHNLFYLDDKTIVVFLFPEANTILKKQVGTIQDLLLPGLSKNV